jgi:hypothetical protein
VRIGIGHPGVKELVHSYVLGDFAKADREGWLEPLLEPSPTMRDAGQGRRRGFMNKRPHRAGPMWDVTENGRMPTAEERNARG